MYPVDKAGMVFQVFDYQHSKFPVFPSLWDAKMPMDSNEYA